MLTVKYVNHMRDEERVFEAQSVNRIGGAVMVSTCDDVEEVFGVGPDGVEMPGDETYQSSLYVMNRFGATVAKYFLYEKQSGGYNDGHGSVG